MGTIGRRVQHEVRAVFFMGLAYDVTAPVRKRHEVAPLVRNRRIDERVSRCCDFRNALHEFVYPLSGMRGNEERVRMHI